MALWSHVMVNREHVGLIDVQRLTPQHHPEYGEVCRYRWVLLINDTGVRLQGELDCAYGSWVVLYAAVLAAAKGGTE